ncbi:hypothetical protein E2C01_086044 [Portunus trituberculatus]|uniref:Uncharacterized protein n=1 Tax=Portunus trituberculatus TaxID=210409 RepID=A0A5B7JFA3_PORTR|nr:hypothetical protein [Portunus trituberculatus]
MPVMSADPRLPVMALHGSSVPRCEVADASPASQIRIRKADFLNVCCASVQHPVCHFSRSRV